MDNVNKISAFIRMKNAEYTIKACIMSIIEYVDEIVIIDNLSIDGSSKIVEEFNSKKIQRYTWPFELVKAWTPEAAKLKEDDPHSKIAMSNFAMNKCSNDWVLKVDADMVFTEWGMNTLLETNFTKPFLGLGGYEVIGPRLRTVEFSGEEPRFWNRTLDGGLKFQKYFDTGGEIIWSNQWPMTGKGWGPKFESLGKGPFWLHYGWLLACDENRPYRDLPIVALTACHHPEIVKNIHKIFNSHQKW
jgi:glycosyltransferase involved in cell wall biosynthesis